MHKILFSLAERKTPLGEFLPNIYVVGAINHGEEYSTEIEIEDIALKRRFAFIEFEPKASNFDSTGMHWAVKDVTRYLESSKDFIDVNLTSAEEVFAQATTYGSYVSWSEYLRQLEAYMKRKLSYEEIANDLLTNAGALFFKKETVGVLKEKLMMLQNTTKFDFDKIIAEKDTSNDVGSSSMDVIMRTYFYIVDKVMADAAWLTAKSTADGKVNANNVLAFLSHFKKTNMFAALIQDLNSKYKKSTTEAATEESTKEAKANRVGFIKAITTITMQLEITKDKELVELRDKFKEILQASKD